MSTSSSVKDMQIDEPTPRRQSVSHSRHSSVSSVDNAIKKRKRELGQDGVSDYRVAFAGIRKGLEKHLTDANAKLSKTNIALVLESFSRVESMFMDVYTDNIALKAQLKVFETLNVSAQTQAPSLAHTNLPPLTYSSILRAKDPQALIEPYCTPRPGVPNEVTIARSTSPFKTFNPPSKRNAIILKPRAGDTRTSDQIKEVVLTKVRPQCPSVKITQFRKLQGGGVYIETATSEDLQMVRAAPALSDAGVTISTLRDDTPHMIVYDTPTDLSDADLLSDIIQHNLKGSVVTDALPLINIVARRKTRSGAADRCNRLITVTGSAREVLLNQERIYGRDWQSYRVQDFFNLTRCFKCQKFGHPAKYCKSQDSTCGHCAEIGHVFTECPNKKIAPKCALCKTTSHDTRSNLCPEYIRELALHKSKINYDL